MNEQPRNQTKIIENKNKNTHTKLSDRWKAERTFCVSQFQWYAVICNVNA